MSMKIPPPPECGKKPIATYTQAQRVIKDMARIARLKGKQVRGQDIYRCDRCHQWHTTSNSYTQQRKPRQDAA